MVLSLLLWCSFRQPPNSANRAVKRFYCSSSGAPFDSRLILTDRTTSSSGSFYPNLLCRHQDPFQPKELPKVVSWPRISGFVQSQPISALHTPPHSSPSCCRSTVRLQKDLFITHVPGESYHVSSRADSASYACPRALAFSGAWNTCASRALPQCGA